jgi:hypothetical protein
LISANSGGGGEIVDLGGEIALVVLAHQIFGAVAADQRDAHHLHPGIAAAR